MSSNTEVGKIINKNNCSFGDFESAKRRFLVIGNSFSAAELEMFKILVDDEIGSVTITSSLGASVVPEIENTGPLAEANNYYWNFVIPGMIETLRMGDIIIMVNDGADFSPATPNHLNVEKLLKLKQGLSRMAEELSKRSISIIYQSGIPFLRETNCTPDTALRQWWHFKREPPCNYYTKQDTLERRREYHELLRDLEKKFENFLVLDLFEVFCPGDVCKYFNEEEIFLYRDEYFHPSVEACQLAQPVLLESVMKSIENEFQHN